MRKALRANIYLHTTLEAAFVLFRARQTTRCTGEGARERESRGRQREGDKEEEEEREVEEDEEAEDRECE